MGEEKYGRRQKEEMNKIKNGWGKKRKEKTNKPKAFVSAFALISTAAEQCRCTQYGIGHVFPC